MFHCEQYRIFTYVTLNLFIMAQNPLFSNQQSPNNATAPSKRVNSDNVKVPQTHNTFDLSYPNFTTQRFGLLHPFVAKACVAGDTMPFGNSHNVRSLPFSAPINSPITLNKDYFLIPNYAIQPYTWEYIFRSPGNGEDVPSDAQNLFPFKRLVSQICFLINDAYGDQNIITNPIYSWYLLLALESLCSKGSLISNLGLRSSISFNVDGNLMTLDEFFDYFFSQVIIYASFDFGNSSYSYATGDADTYDSSRIISMSEMLSLLRSFPHLVNEFTISWIIEEPSITLSVASYTPAIGDDFLDEDCVRIDRLMAYQIACNQFYVNPHVDPVYNAQLYRDNFMTLFRSLNPSVTLDYFSLNGVDVPYDYFSYHYWNNYVTSIIDAFYGSIDNLPQIWASLDLLFYVFGFREQLRFGDYFTDSRTQPLGFGPDDPNGVAVVDDSVNIVDISQKIILQRFRNNTVKIGNDTDEYLSSIFGEEMSPDYHLPRFIVHTEFPVDGTEVSNTTSDNQGNIVTNLRSGEDSAAFSISINMPCILIGISYFSMPRLYCCTTDREYFHMDRYDMFNPMLQYFGDQEVYGAELNPILQNSFAYHTRNAEYKQSIPVANGGFATTLKSWAFVTDIEEQSRSSIIQPDYISPLIIRAYDFEFNRFLAQNTGLSLANGFHFIVTYNNKLQAIRPMDVNPQTL